MNSNTDDSDTSGAPWNLNEQRRLAVQQRIDGKTLAEAAQLSGLSNPTIISAHKAYLKGGWTAVDVSARGRRSGADKLDRDRQDALKQALLDLPAEEYTPNATLWHYSSANRWLLEKGHKLTDRTTIRYLARWGIDASTLKSDMGSVTDIACSEFVREARKNSQPLYWCHVKSMSQHTLFLACSSRRKLSWHAHSGDLSETACIDFLNRLLQHAGGRVAVVLKGMDISRTPDIQHWFRTHADQACVFAHGVTPLILGTQAATSASLSSTPINLTAAQQSTATTAQSFASPLKDSNAMTALSQQYVPEQNTATLTHLQRLEAESIHIMREVMAEADNPVMLYSVGKDSAVMLHLAIKAFSPAPPPFPLLHVDTTWKFRAMYEFRDRIAKELGFELLTHVNQDGVSQGVNPFTHGSALHTDIMKTEGLKQALDKHKFDVAFGGARRDEEKSRAKERIFSFRTAQHRWEPKNQRPELWRAYNARKRLGESIRVFPLSNWTELDIWQYIHQQNIPIVPLYLAAERPVVERDGSLIMVDDERMPLQAGEVPMMRNVRFRTLGCYPLTGAVESTAATLPEVIQEMLLTQSSERQGRMIDHDSAASMEKKKQEGYF